MLDAVEDGEELRFAALWTLFVGVTINVLASVLLVVLVYYMWRRQLLKLNLFVSMVTMMSISSAVAVGNFYQKFVTGPSPQMLSLSRLFVGIFGVSESLWGFQIISTVSWLALSKRDESVKRLESGLLIYYMIAINTIVSLAVGHVMYFVSDRTAYAVYGWARVTIMVCSTLLISSLYRKVLKQTNSNDRMRSPLYRLLRRLAFYPIANIVCRLGAIPYHVYHDFYSQQNPSHQYLTTFNQYEEPLSSKIVLFLFVILTPMNGIFNLIIFTRVRKCGVTLVDMLLCRGVTAVGEAVVVRDGGRGPGMRDSFTSEGVREGRESNVSNLSIPAAARDTSAHTKRDLSSLSTQGAGYGDFSYDYHQYEAKLDGMDEHELLEELHTETGEGAGVAAGTDIDNPITSQEDL